MLSTQRDWESISLQLVRHSIATILLAAAVLMAAWLWLFT
jgi:hypothetical protein